MYHFIIDYKSTWTVYYHHPQLQQRRSTPWAPAMMTMRVGKGQKREEAGAREGYDDEKGPKQRQTRRLGLM